ncbi:MAG: type I DNA topoisomerase [Elusimicrobiota bacterium]
MPKKSLLIVESPTKEKTIGKILGKDFVIKSSYGHVRDLPARELGVDVKNGFEPDYIPLPKSKKILPDLAKHAEQADKVYLATDYDREGEAIAWHLTQLLGLDKKKARRITFHEITSQAIQEAIKNPRDIDEDLVNAQTARRVLDRLVGYKLSPLLWRKVRRGLSAGRVQSVAVHLLCLREAEIEKFTPEEYWTLAALLEKSGQEFTASLHSGPQGKFDKFAFRTREPLDEVLKKLEGASYIVKSVEPKERRRSPAPPFTTASLQQDSSRRLHYSASRTMVVAQQLYEGVDLGPEEGAVGLITYMRTDSVQVAAEARAAAAAHIEKTYGKNFLPPQPRVYKTKTKRAQEAHEAIRPTQPSRTPDSVKKDLSPEQFRLYELIWQRFMASQMADAVYDTVTADIAASDYIFRAAGRTLKFAGFLSVYKETEEESGAEGALPPLAAGDAPVLNKLLPEQHFTEPPPRYNEASLVKTLEEHGIGRPSTYAPIIQTILDRGYARLEERRLYPTELGRLVDRQLSDHFPDIVDTGFTAKVEDKLDGIAGGNLPWRDVIKEFYDPFARDIQKADTAMEAVKIKPKETDEKCPKCGKGMLLRENRFGRYLACADYPACRTTFPVDKEGKKVEPIATSEVCPKCSKPMAMKVRGRSRFLACTGYPDCRTTFSVDREGNKIIRPAPEPTNLKCRKCDRPMLKRFGKRGPFLACSGFPKCRNIQSVAAEEKADGTEAAAVPASASAAKAPAARKPAKKKKPSSAA